jgi:hypothetical protein
LLAAVANVRVRVLDNGHLISERWEQAVSVPQCHPACCRAQFADDAPTPSQSLRSRTGGRARGGRYSCRVIPRKVPSVAGLTSATRAADALETASRISRPVTMPNP